MPFPPVRKNFGVFAKDSAAGQRRSTSLLVNCPIAAQYHWVWANWAHRETRADVFRGIVQQLRGAMSNGNAICS